MKILGHEQNTEAWLDARKGCITGSKLKGLIVKHGTKRKIGFYELLADRIAIASDGENPMERGHRLEEEALEEWSKKNDMEVERVGLCVSDFNPNIALSPDGLIKTTSGEYTEAVEVKCLSSARHLRTYFENKVPLDYIEQVVQYFIVIETLGVLHFVCYDPRIASLPVFEIRVERGDFEDLIEKYKDYQEEALEEINKMAEQLAF